MWPSISASSYRKLRLHPTWVAGQLREAGFVVAPLELGPRGMCVITAHRPEQASMEPSEEGAPGDHEQKSGHE